MNESPSWITTAIEIHNFHARKLKEDRTWNRKDTAVALQRSLGSISEYLMLASWLKSHRKQMERILNANDALAWVRERQRHVEMDEIDAT